MVLNPFIGSKNSNPNQPAPLQATGDNYPAADLLQINKLTAPVSAHPVRSQWLFKLESSAQVLSTLNYDSNYKRPDRRRSSTRSAAQQQLPYYFE